MSDRPKLIVGNWKMNHRTIAEAKSFISDLGKIAAKSAFHIGLAVPFTMLAAAAQAAKGTKIKIGAQNVSEHDQGAYTGEVSCAMIKDAGATFAIVGHSERRRLFHEDDALVHKKILKCLE